MDNNLHQEAVKTALKPKFHGRKKMVSRYVPLHPDSSERDMRRLANSYMKIVSGELKEVLPDVLEAYKEQQTRQDSSDSYRADGLADITRILQEKMIQASDAISKKAAAFEMEKKLSRIAATIRNTSLREWKKAIKRTLNIDILDEFYKEELYQDAINLWVSDERLKMEYAPMELMSRIRGIIEDGYRSGKNLTEIRNEINHAYKVMRDEVRESAGNNVGFLNSECTRINQETSGVHEYVWSTRNDSRVRPCHRAMEGKTFRWDNPPEMWYDTVSRGRINTGRRCAPGQDYGCRCSAVPKFDLETIDIPIASDPKGAEKIGTIQARRGA